MIELRKKFKSKEWQVKYSSLAKKAEQEVTYEECRKYACEDISSSTIIALPQNKFIFEVPKGQEFHFIGRVDTSRGGNEPISYYKTFEDRDFASFSTINNRNISRYKGGIFFVYNIFPEDIVHIFPLDSDIKREATSEEGLTWLPSLWLTLEELEALTEKMQVYNQITCKTKRKGQIIKPLAVIAFDKMDEIIQMIADRFEIGCIIVHPDEDAINYDKDLLYDECWLNSISYDVMEREYGVDVRSLAYID